MRKKLLALLMCATMVLGTGMTAMAAVPSEDTFKAAETVFKNGSKFDAEYEGKKLVKFTTTDADGKTSVWGLTSFGSNSNTAVKLGKDGDLKDKALTFVGRKTTGTFVKNGNYYVDKNGNNIAIDVNNAMYFLKSEDGATATVNDLVATTSSSAVNRDLAALVVALNPSATAASIIATGTDYVGYTTASGDYLVNADGYRVASYANSKITYEKTPVLYTAADLQVNTDGVYSVGDKLVYIENAGTTAAKSYDVDADGYIQKNDTDKTAKLVKADASSVERSDDADAQYYVVLEQFKDSERSYSSFKRTVAYALDDKSLSSDAVAIKISLYELVESGDKAANSEDAIKYLRNRESVSTSTSITLNKDVLSRTGLKANDSLAVYTIDSSDTVKKDGVNVPRLETLGTATVDGTFTFDVKDYTNHVIIFDGAKDESKDTASNNDGVADTTANATTADTAAKSPVTGDVAPIAALAVVMMGACGAMVVASKKRA